MIQRARFPFKFTIRTNSRRERNLYYLADGERGLMSNRTGWSLLIGDLENSGRLVYGPGSALAMEDEARVSDAQSQGRDEDETIVESA